MANLCNLEMWVAARRVSRALTDEGVTHALVGTAALAVLGYSVRHEDVDFLVETVPTLASFVKEVGVEAVDPLYRTASSTELLVGETKVNLVWMDSARVPFMPPALALVDGVPVASVLQVLNLKCFANRIKDADFFRDYPKLRALLPSPLNLREDDRL